MKAPLLPEELLGPAALRRLGEALYGQSDPARTMSREQPVRVVSDEAGTRLLVRMPFGAKGDVRLLQRGEELVVDVGSSRRNLILPAALARQRAGRARLAEGVLAIEFEQRQPLSGRG